MFCWNQFYVVFQRGRIGIIVTLCKLLTILKQMQCIIVATIDMLQLICLHTFGDPVLRGVTSCTMLSGSMPGLLTCLKYLTR